MAVPLSPKYLAGKRAYTNFRDTIKKPRCVFVTSDYHVLRTATYAMRVHLRADGVGSRTASYFFPNAFIREYVALMMGHPWPTFVLLGMWVLGVFVSESRG